MKTRALNIWDRFSGSFWFLPSLLVLLAASLGLLIPLLEERLSVHFVTTSWLTTTVEGARTILSMIAGAMITVAGVVFSVTMVTLSIAASQFGSRVLRQRMRNRATQLALGAFLGTSVFCFLALKSIQPLGTSQPIPSLSVSVGIALSVGSLFVLIYFIHDVAEVVQAPHVVARLAADLNDSIERLFPERIGEGDEEQEEHALTPDQDPDHVVESVSEGYLQAIEGETLMTMAQSGQLFIRLLVRPGDFIAVGDVIAHLWGDADQGELSDTVNGAMILGAMRTPRQDVNCAIHELAQLTVRALSPGINDPFTAINGIDRLSAALGRLAQRKIPSSVRSDREGTPRLMVDVVRFPEALAAAFNQIRQHARSTPSVGIRMLEGLEGMARRARRQSDAEAIQQQAELLVRSYRDTDHAREDLACLDQQLSSVRATLAERFSMDATSAGKNNSTGGANGERSAEDNENSIPADGDVNG
jgi:uncharacterized membrane protein